MRTRIPVLLIAVCLLVIFGIPHVHAQGSPGFVKIATGVSGVTFVDSSCPSAGTCAYEVTTVNAVGIESVPDPNTTPLVECVIPASGTHTCTLKWTASVTAPPITYNVYQASSVPPTGLVAAEN